MFCQSPTEPRGAVSGAKHQTDTAAMMPGNAPGKFKFEDGGKNRRGRGITPSDNLVDIGALRPQRLQDGDTTPVDGFRRAGGQACVAPVLRVRRIGSRRTLQAFQNIGHATHQRCPFTDEVIAPGRTRVQR